MSELSVDPAQVGADSQRFADLGQVAQGIYSDLQYWLDQLGDFAGDDEVGQQFKAQWKPGIGAAQNLLSGFQQLVSNMGDALKTTADLYTKANDVNTDLAGPVDRV